jgi:3-hydroxyisobutyrate dehydrogenase-like beta-hydroxyacid dehydrogenase
MRVGWIGLGRMGLPMATRLLDAGYSLSIWNRTKSKGRSHEEAAPSDVSIAD